MIQEHPTRSVLVLGLLGGAALGVLAMAAARSATLREWQRRLGLAPRPRGGAAAADEEYGGQVAFI